MPREVVHLQVGQCGNQVGMSFLAAVCKEHCLDPSTGAYVAKQDTNFSDADGDGLSDVLEYCDVFFQPVDKNNPQGTNRKPRAVMIDLEPGAVDAVKESEIGGMFNTQDPNMIKGANGAGNNWAKGHYTEGAELIEASLEAIRTENEKCDASQGFQLFHSLGGGTGSGMGTLLLLKVRDAYPDKITCTYSIFPSPKVSDTVVEPYNAVLSSHQLLENSDETFIIDNEAMYNIMHNVLKKDTTAYEDLNKLITQVTCGITSSIRFPGMLNGDLRKLGVNLVPFPRLHFFLVSQSPLVAQDSQAKVPEDVKALKNQAFEGTCFFANVKPKDGKYLATNFNYRGYPSKISSKTVEDEMQILQSKEQDQFVDWIPNNIKTSIVTTPPRTSDMSCTFVANTTALKGIFQRLATQFGQMYKRKAFLHWYKGEGMDEMEFQEADKNVRDLITEYQDKEDAVYEEESEDEDDNQSDGD